MRTRFRSISPPIPPVPPTTPTAACPSGKPGYHPYRHRGESRRLSPRWRFFLCASVV